MTHDLILYSLYFIAAAVVLATLLCTVIVGICSALGIIHNSDDDGFGEKEW